MISNSEQLLKGVLAQNRAAIPPELTEPRFFELFCAENILKDYRLSYEELFQGLVDGEHDNGADGIYAFVNGTFVHEDFDSTPFKRDVKMELHIIQTKTGNVF